MKILTVCLAGCVRSVAMAKALAAKGFETEYGGVWDVKTSEFTKRLEWAEKVIVCDARLLKQIPHRFFHKVTLGNVGPDYWGYHGHPELVARVNKIVDVWERAGWNFHHIY